LLLSMTGFGEAHRQQDLLAVSVEVRTINSKHFKLTVRAGDGYSGLEPQIEALVRNHIKRGTVQVSLRVNRARHADDYRLNTVALASYREQLEALRHSWRLAEPIGLGPLLQLPGVVDEDRGASVQVDEQWPLISQTLQAALDSMAHMRIEEGQAMRTDLAANCAMIARELDGIELRAPLVAEGYRARLSERLTRTFAEQQVTLDPADMVREVCIFAERSDISEETVRLRSHLDQFATIMDHPDSSGRKLEFLTQEMFREANTIGSKANDVQISMHVIEVKTAIERIREMIQNVE
jgi:uncharacterized protein (TIGR00255 family)